MFGKFASKRRQAGYPILSVHREGDRAKVDCAVSPVLESLEGRMLMHAVTTIENANTPIIATGTEGKDVIDISYYAVDGHKQYMVTVNDTELEYFDCSVPMIVINGRGGDDTIYVNGTAGVTTIISGGAGNDSIFINEFANHFTNKGQYIIDGNAGNNALTLRAGTQTGADLVYDVTSTSVNTKHVFGPKPDDFSPGTQANYANFSKVVIEGNDTNSDTNVHSTAAGTSLMLIWGKGNNKFNVGDGKLDANIKSLVTIEAGGGTDCVALDDRGDVGNDAYQVLANEVNKGAGKPRVMVYDAESELLQANAYNNTINVDGVNKLTQLTVQGNGGDDAFVVGARRLNHNILGALTIDGGTGVNSAKFSSADEAAVNFNITPTTVKSDTTRSLKYANIQTLTVSGNASANKFVVQPSATTKIFLYAGAPFTPDTPVDQLVLNLAGVTGTQLKKTFGDSGTYSFANRQATTFSSIEALPVL